jgi:protein phosphatase 2C
MAQVHHRPHGLVNSANPTTQAAVECLSKLALQKGSEDNITVVVVDLKA